MTEKILFHDKLDSLMFIFNMLAWYCKMTEDSV